MPKAIFGKRVLLESTKTIVEHQKQVSRLRGEHFNIFSLLGLESAENKTHSAFIGDLLNPKGTHHLGSVFLKHFLDIAEITSEFSPENAIVILEYHIGKTDISNETGGRVDILIRDDERRTILIENKIYAGDQGAQIARYVNYNSGNSEVLYLTLEGTDPSEDSKRQKIREEDYRCISYRDTIVDWLELCVREAVDFPIIRETIRQYIILVKKLTHQLSDQKMETDLKNLIKEYYQYAKVIAQYTPELEAELVKTFRNEIKAYLVDAFSDEWTVELSGSLDKQWASIRINNSNWTEHLGLEIQGHPYWHSDKTIYGIVARKGLVSREEVWAACASIDILNSCQSNNEWWAFQKEIFNLSADGQMERLFEEGKRKEFVEEVGEKLVALAEQCLEGLKDIGR